jgi:hypothetical protein
MKRFLEMGKGVRSVKKPEIFSSIIPMFYLSKLMGLAPFSLTYTDDKQGRVGVNLKTSVPAILYTVLWTTGIAPAYIFILTFASFNTLPFWTARTKQVFVPEFVVSGITCVTILATGLTRIRKKNGFIIVQSIGN